MISKIPYLEVYCNLDRKEDGYRLVSVASDDLVLTEATLNSRTKPRRIVRVQTPQGIFDLEGDLNEIAARIDAIRYAACYDGAKEYNAYYKRRSKADAAGQGPGSLALPDDETKETV